MLRTTNRVKLSILICFLLCSVVSCIDLLWHYHCCWKLESNSGVGNQKDTTEKHLNEEPIKIDYDELCPEIKNVLEDKISRGIANTLNKGAAAFCNKYGIEDEIEKKLIWSNTDVGQLLDSCDKDKKSIVLIYLIKPRRHAARQKLVISNSFKSQWCVNLTMEYKCLEGDVAFPIALIKTFQTTSGDINSDGIALYYSEDSGWKRID